MSLCNNTKNKQYQLASVDIRGIIIMKLLTTIDKHILSYWDTAPSERLWAYLVTLPVVLVAMNLIAQLIK